MVQVPDNWESVKELFAAALELDSSERSAFLARNCREEVLRTQIEQLLSNYQQARNFLDDPFLDPGTPAQEVSPTVRAPETPPHADLQSSDPFSKATSDEPEDPMVGRRVGDYRILRRVGQGGMAAVYLGARADDEFHKQVAVKIVQLGLDHHNLLNRFRNERQTLAGLDHPNIVKLLDGGSTQDGLPFMVMDYVEGSPIDDYCDRHKLCIDDRLRVFSRVCGAVQYAHKRGVVHRDLKPGNILVTADGTPKLLDFGIAKVLNAEPSSQMFQATQTGTRCMTPAYASPEQIRGKSVTAATDIYSLGVVLYELLSGHRPYRLTQHTPAEIERAICEQDPETPSTAVDRVETDTSTDGLPITKTPETVSQTREGPPDKLRRRLRGDLDNIVMKALQKEPERRYGSVEDFCNDIECHLHQMPIKAGRRKFSYRAAKFIRRHRVEAWASLVVLVAIGALMLAFNRLVHRDHSGVAPISRIQSLAVLPLVNLSGDPTQEYFSDGITDGLITALSQFSSVRVISRTSTMRYKKTDKSLPQIARELNVDGIIEGTVQRSGERVRITAQLIYGPSDKHVWADSFERETRDVFTLERSVTQEIARQIQVQLKESDKLSSTQSRPLNLTALDAYLQGKYYLDKEGRGSGDDEKRKAQGYFQQAIDADPGFVAPYIGMVAAHDDLLLPTTDDFAIRRKAAEKAVALDVSSSDAHLALGEVRLIDEWNWPAAETEFRHAISLNPNSVNAHEAFGSFLDLMGRSDESWPEFQRAQELDPNKDHLSATLETRGQYDRAIELLLRTIQMYPDDGYAHSWLSRTYAESGMRKQSVSELELAASLFGMTAVATDLHNAFAKSGYTGAMRQYAKDLEYLHETQQIFLPRIVADVYADLGNKDRAFYWLEQAYLHRDVVGVSGGLVELKIDHRLDGLRSDPRFSDLIRRVGLPQ